MNLSVRTETANSMFSVAITEILQARLPEVQEVCAHGCGNTNRCNACNSQTFKQAIYE